MADAEPFFFLGRRRPLLAASAAAAAAAQRTSSLLRSCRRCRSSSRSVCCCENNRCLRRFRGATTTARARTRPSSPSASAGAGNAAFAAGKYLRAGELYRRALDALGAGGGAGHSSLRKQSKKTGAPRCPRSSSGAGKLHSNLAAVALQLGRPSAALASCAAALRAEPCFGRAAVRAATCYVRLGEWALAERALAAAEEAAVRGRRGVFRGCGGRRGEGPGPRGRRGEEGGAGAAAGRGRGGRRLPPHAFVEGARRSLPLLLHPRILSALRCPLQALRRALRRGLPLRAPRPRRQGAPAAGAGQARRRGRCGRAGLRRGGRGRRAGVAGVGSGPSRLLRGEAAGAAAAARGRAQAGDDDEVMKIAPMEATRTTTGVAAKGRRRRRGRRGRDREATEARHPRGLAPPSASAAAEAAASLRSLLAARSEGNDAYAASKFADADAAYSRALLGRAAPARGNGSSFSPLCRCARAAAAGVCGAAARQQGRRPRPRGRRRRRARPTASRRGPWPRDTPRPRRGPGTCSPRWACSMRPAASTRAGSRRPKLRALFVAVFVVVVAFELDLLFLNFDRRRRPGLLAPLQAPVPPLSHRPRFCYPAHASQQQQQQVDSFKLPGPALAAGEGRRGRRAQAPKPIAPPLLRPETGPRPRSRGPSPTPTCAPPTARRPWRTTRTRPRRG